MSSRCIKLCYSRGLSTHFYCIWRPVKAWLQLVKCPSGNRPLVVTELFRLLDHWPNCSMSFAHRPPSLNLVFTKWDPGANRFHYKKAEVGVFEFFPVLAYSGDSGSHFKEHHIFFKLPNTLWSRADRCRRWSTKRSANNSHTANYI